jgi:hypothetical protein
MVKPTIDSAAAPPQPIEISAIGRYPVPAAWESNGKTELAVLAAGNWHPTTADFEAVAEVPNKPKPRTIVTEVGMLSELLGIIIKTMKGVDRPNASIARLNIISHANPGVIGLSGTVADDGSCSLGRFDINDPLNSEGIDSSAMTWLNTTGKTLRDAARSKFTSDAEIWLVVCNGAVGVSNSLVLELSGAFGVRVAAYKDAVHYWPERDAQGTRVTKRTTTSIGLNGTKGDGYFCWVKVPTPKAGEHLAIQGTEDKQGKRIKMPPKP